MKEMRIFNVEISGVEQAMVASGYPMSKTYGVNDYGLGRAGSYLLFDPIDKIMYGCDFKNGRFNKVKDIGKIVPTLAKAVNGSGHDSFLKGITVTFDISYPVFWSPQFQRYHFADIVSST